MQRCTSQRGATIAATTMTYKQCCGSSTIPSIMTPNCLGSQTDQIVTWLRALTFRKQPSQKP
eukprot:2313593-Amphidinium_carterae.1